MATCEVCKKGIKLFDPEITLMCGKLRIHICSECKKDVLDYINNIKELPDLTQKNKAIENLPAKYNAYVKSGISRAVLSSPTTTVRKCKIMVRGGRKEIGINTMLEANAVFCVTNDGYVFFEHKPDLLYTPVSYNWGGPMYSEVSHSTGKSREKVNEKTKRKGGLGGAIIGTAIMPGAGTLVGYGMTSKKRTKGKNVVNNNGSTYTSNVEVSSSANMQLRRLDGMLISLEFACNNTVNAFMLGVEWGIDPRERDQIEKEQSAIESNESQNKSHSTLEQFPDVEIIMPENEGYSSNDSVIPRNNEKLNEEKSSDESDTSFMDNEMMKIKILKEYKSLLDEGIITQQEFELKKKEIM